MRISERFKSESKYLSKEDLAIKGTKPVRYREVPAIISDTSVEEFNQDDGTIDKLCVYFDGKNKALACNATNRNVLADNLGDDTDDWVGKQVIVWVDPSVQMRGKVVGGLKVRFPVSQPDEEPPHEDEEAPF